MASHIKIEGDTVTIVEEVVARTVHLDEWMNKVASGKQPTVELTLPENSLFASVGAKRAILVTATAPMKRTILRRKNQDEVGYVSSTLAMPWVVFVHVFNFEGGLSTHHRTQIFFSSVRPKGWDSYVGIPPLHNVGASDGYVCLGDEFRLNMGLPLAEKVAEIERHFWTAPFNFDLGPYEDGVNLQNVGGGYRSWAYRSSRKAAFIHQDIKWGHDSLDYYVKPNALLESPLDPIRL